MQFLADENCDQIIVTALRQAGHKVDYIAELSPGIPDEKVLESSLKQQLLLITEDNDFAELVFRDAKPAWGIVLVRILPEHRKLKGKRMLELVSDYDDRLEHMMVTLTVDDIRSRPLPV